MAKQSIELNQAIQSILSTGEAVSDIPLIKGKPTLVRVYLDALLPGLNHLQGVVTGQLKIQILGRRPAATAVLTSYNSIALGGGDFPERFEQQQELDLTLNFEMDIEDLFSEEAGGNGCLDLEIKVDAIYLNNTPKGFNSASLQASFETSNALRVHMVGLRYSDLDGYDYYPDKQHFENARQSIRNLYPISDCDSSHLVVSADPEFAPPFSDVDAADPDWEWYLKVTLVHAQLLALRTLDLDDNPADFKSSWYYGMLDYPADDFFRGAVSGFQLEPDSFNITCCGPVEDAGGLYAAHEIAHCLGLHHPGIGDQTREDPDYPFVNGHISIDEYPKSALAPVLRVLREGIRKIERIKNPELRKKAEKELAARVEQMWKNNETLAKSRTLKLYFERYKKRKFQQIPDWDLLFEYLQEWEEAEKNYGAEHMGYRAASWKFDAAVLPYRAYFDFMGYANQGWVSSYSYKKLYDKIGRLDEDTLRPKKPKDNSPARLCIIGIYNEYLGSGSIKYVFNTLEMPSSSNADECRSVQLLFDAEPVPSHLIFHKSRSENTLGDPVFRQSGVFKCVVDPADFESHRELKLGVLRLGRKSRFEKCQQEDANDYRIVDRKILDAGIDSGSSPSRNSTFTIIKSSVEFGASDYFLKLDGEKAPNSTYIARACFLDHEKWKKSNKIGFSKWMTIGVNFDRSEEIYIDKNHCLIPARWTKDIAEKIRQLANEEPLISLCNHLQKLHGSEQRQADLFAFSLELISQTGVQSNRIFKGLVIEKPHTPGKFYFINSDHPDYQKLKTTYRS